MHTLRAVENFPITGNPISIYPDLIRALACIKQAAALANRELGLLGDAKADVIVKACEEIRAGKLHEQFVVDVIQGGAGTSTNMNANEVIANRALELLGHSKGEYKHLHPNEDVNMSQSTNDVYPTSLTVAGYFGISELVDAMAVLRRAFEGKAEEFRDVLKMGRTQLQDAVPMTLGQEFSTYAVMLGEDEERLKEAALLIREINLGATAIGTGINAHPEYAERVCKRLAESPAFRSSPRPTWWRPRRTAAPSCSCRACSSASREAVQDLQRPAVALERSARGLRRDQPAGDAGRLVDHAGQGQPGDPGGRQSDRFRGHRQRRHRELRGGGRSAQLNAFEPIIAHSLFKSITHLRNGCLTLAGALRQGHTANRERLRASVEQSIGVVTALNPYIGYANATEVAQEALATGKSVYDLVLEKKLLSKERLDEILQPEVLTRPRPLLAARE